VAGPEDDYYVADADERLEDDYGEEYNAPGSRVIETQEPDCD